MLHDGWAGGYEEIGRSARKRAAWARCGLGIKSPLPKSPSSLPSVVLKEDHTIERESGSSRFIAPAIGGEIRAWCLDREVKVAMRIIMAQKDITISPAYGRDYKSAKEVLAAWEDNKDFKVVKGK